MCLSPRTREGKAPAIPKVLTTKVDSSYDQPLSSVESCYLHHRRAIRHATGEDRWVIGIAATSNLTASGPCYL